MDGSDAPEKNDDHVFKENESLPAKESIAADGKRKGLKSKDMMVSGFAQNTPKEQIERAVLEVVGRIGIAVEKVFAVRPLSSFGIIRFKHAGDIEQFQERWTAPGFDRTYAGKKLRINDSKGQRVQAQAAPLAA